MRQSSKGLPGQLSSRARGISAFSKRRRIEFAQESFTRCGKSGLQPAAWREHAGPAVLTEAFDQRLAFERTYDLAKRDRLRRPRQREAATDATLRGDKATIAEVAHNLGKMIARNLELRRNLIG